MSRTKWPPTVMGTAEGDRIDLLDPDPKEITMKAVARGLSRTCRFGGQTARFYSVAEHSVRAATYLKTLQAPKKLRLAALLHDGHEAFVGDLTRPLRALLPKLDEVTDRLDQAIALNAGIDPALLTHPEVRRADEVMLSVEGRLLLPDCDHAWPTDAEPDPATARYFGWDPRLASAIWRARVDALGGSW